MARKRSTRTVARKAKTTPFIELRMFICKEARRIGLKRGGPNDGEILLSLKHAGIIVTLTSEESRVVARIRTENGTERTISFCRDDCAMIGKIRRDWNTGLAILHILLTKTLRAVEREAIRTRRQAEYGHWRFVR